MSLGSAHVKYGVWPGLKLPNNSFTLYLSYTHSTMLLFVLNKLLYRRKVNEIYSLNQNARLGKFHGKGILFKRDQWYQLCLSPHSVCIDSIVTDTRHTFFSFLDVDECTLGTFNCSAGAVCINTEGSYNCSCKPGYSEDGQVCTGETLLSFVNLETRRKMGPVLSCSGLWDRHWGQAKDKKLYCPSDCETWLGPSLFSLLIALLPAATSRWQDPTRSTVTILGLILNSIMSLSR